MDDKQSQFMPEELKIRYECVRISFEQHYQKQRWETKDAESLYDWAVFGIRPYDVKEGKKVEENRYSNEHIELRLKCLDISNKYRNKSWLANITTPAE